MFDEYGMMPMDFGEPGFGGGGEFGGYMNPGYMGFDQSSFGAMPNYRGPRENPRFNLDEQLLLNLGFFPQEIEILSNMVGYYGYVTTQKLTQPPFCICNAEVIKRVNYAYKISMGDAVVDVTDIESIAKHFKKLHNLSGKSQIFNCLYVKHKPFDKIARVAVVVGLPEGSFQGLNSNNYPMTMSTYPVEKIAKEWVTIRSMRELRCRPCDRLNDSLEHREWGIPDILKVEEVGDVANGKPWIIKIHKSHCRLCNRFMVVITTRKFAPEVTEHHGGYELVLADGSLVHIFARTTDLDSYGNPKDTFPATTNHTVTFSYGFYSSQIFSKVTEAVKAISSMVPVVYSRKMASTIPYGLVPPYSGMESIRESTGDEESDLEELVD